MKEKLTYTVTDEGCKFIGCFRFSDRLEISFDGCQQGIVVRPYETAGEFSSIFLDGTRVRVETR